MNILTITIALLHSTWNLASSITVIEYSNSDKHEHEEITHYIVDQVVGNEPLEIHPMKHYLTLKMNGSIFENTFDNFGKLRHFSLVHSHIEDMEDNILNKLKELEYLAFINNRGNIRVTQQVLMKLTHLKELIIHLNNRIILEENALKSLDNLEVLSVDNQTYNKFSRDTIGNCTKLKYLSWSNGFLRKIDSEAFQKLKKLVSIVLEGLHLKYIEPSTFKGLPLLKIISLAKNDLLHISGEEFQLLPSLETLNLGNNLLVSIDAAVIFKNNPNVQILEIFNNKLPCEVILNLVYIMKKQGAMSLDAREVGRCRNLRFKTEFLSA